MNIFYRSLISIFCLLLVACDSGTHYAPVTEISTIEPIPKMGTHRVMAHETLYEIAWRYGLDYRYLAARNQITLPYAIRAGQIIHLRDGEPVVLEPVNESISQWTWPVKGKIIRSFSDLHKGINIAGKRGDPIYATAAGKVVYCGDGLRGYGKLIILKHNNLYLSAYAHNQTLFVKEGDWVKQGQKIAEMGNTGADKIMLHFEVRYAGKPIDPIGLLRS